MDNRLPRKKCCIQSPQTNAEKRSTILENQQNIIPVDKNEQMGTLETCMTMTFCALLRAKQLK
uniref:Uncharacterized protein n=1 Tax=Manihot esculenta TaxID=3983 RepID=A0A2C9VLV5_MANES